MIIVCVNELGGPTGYHKAVVDLANSLSRAGHEVAILAFQGVGDGSARMIPKWPLDVDVPAYALRTLAASGGRLLHRNYHTVFTARSVGVPWSYSANNLATLRELNEALTEEDTILFTSAHTAYIMHHAIKSDSRRARTVLQVHGDYRKRPELWDMFIAARPSIDRIQVVSSGLRDLFVGTVDSANITWIPNVAVDSGRVPVKEHKGVNIVIAASIQPLKNQKDAIRAIARIEDPDVHLTLWGESHTAYAKQCASLAADLGVDDRVHLRGFGSARDIYSTADVVLMTSLHEGFGLSLMEAGMHGIPAVAYDFEYGPRDIIDDGSSGFIVPLGDVEALARRLKELADDPALRQRMGAQGRAFVEMRFSAASVMKEYEGLVGQPGAGQSLDLAARFRPDGTAPIPRAAISSETVRVGFARKRAIKVSGPVQPFDVEIDDGRAVSRAPVRRARDATHIILDDSRIAIVSYVARPGSADRHYLATSGPSGVFVESYMRRDASCDVAASGVADTIHPSSIRMIGHLRPQAFAHALRTVASKGARDVMWKLRQLARSR